MNLSMKQTRLLALRTIGALALTLAAAGAWAQDTTKTSVRHGEPSVATDVRDATIVYVEGNNLVLKLEDGKVEHLIVPFDERFTIDGKQLTVAELKPGTRLTQTITTTTTPRYVNTVRTIKGKVWHVNAPGSIIVSLPDGTNQLYKVPSHATFKIDGRDKTVFELKKGMKLEATIITDSPETVVASSKETTGRAPVLAMPVQTGVLHIPHQACSCGGGSYGNRGERRATTDGIAEDRHPAAAGWLAGCIEPCSSGGTGIRTEKGEVAHAVTATG